MPDGFQHLRPGLIVFTYSLLSPLCLVYSPDSWLTCRINQYSCLGRVEVVAGCEVRGVRASGPRRHAVTWPLWRHAAATLPYLTRTSLWCWRALVCCCWYDCRIMFSVLTFSPPPLHDSPFHTRGPRTSFINGFGFFFGRLFGDWVGLLGRGKGSGRHWEGKGINTAVGNVFIGNYKNWSVLKIHIETCKMLWTGLNRRTDERLSWEAIALSWLCGIHVVYSVDILWMQQTNTTIYLSIYLRHLDLVSRMANMNKKHAYYKCFGYRFWIKITTLITVHYFGLRKQFE